MARVQKAMCKTLVSLISVNILCPVIYKSTIAM